MICIDTTLLVIIIAPLICGAIYYRKGENEKRLESKIKLQRET